jgi:hypothetical protein
MLWPRQTVGQLCWLLGRGVHSQCLCQHRTSHLLCIHRLRQLLVHHPALGLSYVKGGHGCSIIILAQITSPSKTGPRHVAPCPAAWLSLCRVCTACTACSNTSTPFQVVGIFGLVPTLLASLWLAQFCPANLCNCNCVCAGIWSQIKRAPQAVKKRKTFEVPGPAVDGAMPLDARARQIFR